MASGTYEPDGVGTPCFRPGVPRAPTHEDVRDLVRGGAGHAVARLDARLSAWGDVGAVRLLARLEAVLSARAEGATTTFPGLLTHEASPGSAPDAADSASVAALARAVHADHGQDLLATVLSLHRRLFEGGSPRDAAEAGRWKTRTNRTVDPDAPNGLFAYARPASVSHAMAEWATYVAARDGGVPELVRQCLGHWMFEHVHPFVDGNGRVGRLLVPIVLQGKGVTATRCAYLSEGVHADKALYVDALRYARTSGDALGFVGIMLGFVRRGLRPTSHAWTASPRPGRVGSG